jgi:DNA-binding MarR family transcriptional regulator
VRRERCPEDRRQVLCWITESGLRLLAELDKPLAAAGIKSMEPLPRDEQQALIRTLEKIREKLG